MEPIQKEELERLVELAGAATPGPWTAWEGNTSVHYGTAEKNTYGEYLPAGNDLLEICQTDNGREECEDITPGDPVDDAAYIAAAHPTTVRRMAQELLQYRAAPPATAAAEAGGAWVAPLVSTVGNVTATGHSGFTSYAAPACTNACTNCQKEPQVAQGLPVEEGGDKG